MNHIERLERAWDGLRIDAASEGITVDSPAIIESGALGRRVTGTEPPKAFVVSNGARAWGRRWAS